MIWAVAAIWFARAWCLYTSPEFDAKVRMQNPGAPDWAVLFEAVCWPGCALIAGLEALFEKLD